MRIIQISALLVSLAAVPAVQSTPGFSGSWALDAARSTSSGGGGGQRETPAGGRGGGLGLGPSADHLVITEEPMRVLIVERRGADTARVILALDGKPEPRAIAVGRSAGATASTVSKWDKNRLTTTVTLANGATGPVQYEEVRYLEQGSLIVEIRQVGSPNARRVVYTREK